MRVAAAWHRLGLNDDEVREATNSIVALAQQIKDIVSLEEGRVAMMQIDNRRLALDVVRLAQRLDVSLNVLPLERWRGEADHDGDAALDCTLDTVGSTQRAVQDALKSELKRLNAIVTDRVKLLSIIDHQRGLLSCRLSQQCRERQQCATKLFSTEAISDGDNEAAPLEHCNDLDLSDARINSEAQQIVEDVLLSNATTEQQVSEIVTDIKQLETEGGVTEGPGVEQVIDAERHRLNTAKFEYEDSTLLHEYPSSFVAMFTTKSLAPLLLLAKCERTRREDGIMSDLKSSLASAVTRLRSVYEKLFSLTQDQRYRDAPGDQAPPCPAPARSNLVAYRAHMRQYIKNVEDEATTLNRKLERIAKITPMLERRAKIIQEHNDMEKEGKSRLLNKRLNMASILLHEERVRRAVAKELPRINADLIACCDQWDREIRSPLVINGRCLRDSINQQYAPNTTPAAHFDANASALARIDINAPVARGKSETPRKQMAGVVLASVAQTSQKRR